MKKFILSAILLLGLAFNSNAQHDHSSPTTAEDFLRHVLEVELQELLNADASEEDRLAAFLPFVARNVDAEHFVRIIVGRKHWLNASEQERNAAVHLMQIKIAKLYLEYFEEIRSGRIIIKEVVPYSYATHIKTKVIITTRGNEMTFEIGFIITEKNDHFIIRDVSTEVGIVSIIVKTRFRDTARRGGINGLIKQLKTETA